MKILTREKLEQVAYQIIGIIDYDIQKECEYNMIEDGEDDLITEVTDFLERFLNND